MRRALVFSLALAGCGILEPVETTFEGRVRIEPPAFYADVYAEVVECWRSMGWTSSKSYDDVRWYSATSIRWSGRLIGGVTQFPDEITLFVGNLVDESLVSHEIGHHVTQVGNDLHVDDVTVPCQSDERPSGPVALPEFCPPECSEAKP